MMKRGKFMFKTDFRCMQVTEKSGFSLIEVMIAMAVASILMIAIGSAYWAQSKTAREQQVVVEMQQNMRAAMHLIRRDIMMAGYDGDVTSPREPRFKQLLRLLFLLNMWKMIQAMW